MRYKVTVYVETPYATIVKANSEKEAIKIALERDAPPLLAYHEDPMEYEWASDGLWEFPNLGKDETPDVEEV